MAHCKGGNSLITVNEQSLEMVQPCMLQYKLLETVLLLWKKQFSGVDTQVCLTGEGHVAQIYAIHQSISKALVIYHQKHVDEVSKKGTRDTVIQYDWTLLLADPHRCKSKKLGSPGAGAGYQKSY